CAAASRLAARRRRRASRRHRRGARRAGHAVLGGGIASVQLRAPCALAFTLGLLGSSVCCGSQAGLGGSDQDGMQGGNYTFAVTVNDTAFSPSILKTQNAANVTIVLTNTGTKPHDFVVDCAGSSCFPDASAMAPVAPQASSTAQFVTPYTEGIY